LRPQIGVHVQCQNFAAGVAPEVGRRVALTFGSEVGNGPETQLGQFRMMICEEAARAFRPEQNATPEQTASRRRQAADVPKVEARQSCCHRSSFNR
jgi:hypothetical protein